MYYTYILRCEDNSLYTGITTNLERRIEEHFSKGKKCAKYTMRHNAKNLEIAWQSENRILASKLEYYIKTLSKSQKENLIQEPENLNLLFENKIDCNLYIKINL